MDEDALLNRLVDMFASHYYSQEDAARVLEQAGYATRRHPAWSSATNFWQSAIWQLHRGATRDGIHGLLAHAGEDWPGSRQLREIAADYRAAYPPEADTEAEAPPTAGSRPSGQDKAPLEQTRIVVEPPRPAPDPPTGESASATYPTITVYGGDQHDEFERAVRAHVPETELLYAAHQQAAFRVVLPDGTNGETVRRRVAEELGASTGGVEVTYDEHPFRPYALRRLVAHGPDNQSFELRNVPATSPVSDIAYAVLQNYAPESVRDGQGRYMRTTVHRINADGTSTPLDPSEPLHGQVQDGDELRVATEANAGSWREAILRARSQIMRYAREHPNFQIIDTDDPELPTFYVFEFEANGFGPPEDDDGPIRPTLVSLHRVQLVLPATYPNNAPIAVWQTEIFHPNVLPEPRGLTPKGFVCLGALLDAYRPNLDLGGLCAMLVAMAGYHVYDALEPSVQDGEGYLNRRAAAWARSDAGRELIAARGGKLQRETGAEREPAVIRFEVVDADGWGAWE
jgi:hypothetical protein